MSRHATLQLPVTTTREAERWSSAMSGGALLVNGLKRRSLDGALLSGCGETSRTVAPRSSRNPEEA